MNLVAQTTRSSWAMSEWSPEQWILVLSFVAVTFLPAITAMILALRSRAQTNANATATTNLAATVKDIGTNVNGVPMGNVSPETIPTLNNIINGGTGDGGR